VSKTVNFSASAVKFQEELNARKNEEFQLVPERANRVIKQVAESEIRPGFARGCLDINPQAWTSPTRR
jgi:outer membrane protein